MIPEIQSDGQEMMASIFADPEDLRRYKEAIANGASEQEALKVGDNGVGAWGDDTTSMTDPIVALPPDMPGVEHNRLVQIMGPKGTVVARIADKAPNNGRIDLNPAAAMAVGHSGGLSPVRWKFLDQRANPATPYEGEKNLSRLNMAMPALPDLNIAEGPPLGGMPEIAMPNSLTGIDMLTPIGTDEQVYESPDFGEQQYSQPDQQPEQTVGGIKLLAIKPPALNSLRRIGTNPDGTYKLERGYSYDPAGGGTLSKEENGNIIKWNGPNAKAEVITPPAAKNPIIKTDGSGKMFAIDPTTLKSQDITPAGFEGKAEEKLVKEIGSVDIGETRGAQVLNKIPSDLRTSVQAIAEYRYPKLSSFALRSHYFQKMLSIITAYDPSFDVKNYDARQKLMNDFSAGKTKDNIVSLNTVIGHLGTAADAYKDLGNVGIIGGPQMNYLKNLWLKHAGFASPGKYGVASDTAATEIAKALHGGVPNQTEIDRWQEKFSNADTPQQFHGVLQEAINLLSSRMTPYYDQYKNVMGKDLPYSLLNAEPKNVVAKYGDEKTRAKLKTDQPTAPFAEGTSSPEQQSLPDANAAPTSTGSKFEEGKLYVDDQGMKARWVNGQWQPVE